MKEFLLKQWRTVFMISAIAILVPCFLIMGRTVKWVPLVVQQRHTLEKKDTWRNNYEPYTENGTNFSLNITQLPNAYLRGNNTRLILLWCPLFNGMETVLDEGASYFRDSGCPESRCEVTFDRSRILESDAVVFHMRTVKLFDIPSNRTERQKWIFLNLESPPYSRFHGFTFMSGMFNWTMTYRRDSDIFTPYGTVLATSQKPTLNESELYKKWKKKSKMSMGMISHCSTNGKREDYIRELRKYMEVDVFGLCEIGTCPSNKTHLCLENFSKEYFFYLAFENSICDGYITEKFYRTLKYNMIPVVFGGGQYSIVAPPNSYINAFDFKSPKELSSHLNKVASDFSLYAKHLHWKLEGYEVQSKFSTCNLCEKLHSRAFHVKSVYMDIDDWWVKRANCRRWQYG